MCGDGMKSDPLVNQDDCWLWAGPINSQYGLLFRDGEYYLAHRLMYEAVKGPIPVGLEIDHLCRVKICVNPDHLEAVTHAVNMQRIGSYGKHSHCKRGHELIPENLYYERITMPDGFKKVLRHCKTCKLMMSKLRYERMKGSI